MSKRKRKSGRKRNKARKAKAADATWSNVPASSLPSQSYRVYGRRTGFLGSSMMALLAVASLRGEANR